MKLRTIKSRIFLSLHKMRRRRVLFYLLLFVFIYSLWLFYHLPEMQLQDTLQARNMTHMSVNTKRKDVNHADEVMYIANNIEVSVLVSEYPERTLMVVTLYNSGTISLTYSEWRIYFTHIFQIIQIDSVCDIVIERMNGGLHILSPNPAVFKGIFPQADVACAFVIKGLPIKNCNMPNWYVESTAIKGPAFTIRSTQDDQLSFVSIEETPRIKSNRITPEQRYKENKKASSMFDKNSILPTPKSILMYDLPEIHLKEWALLKAPGFENARNLLTKALNIKQNVELLASCIHSAKTCIQFNQLKVLDEEEYILAINGRNNSVTITAATPTGAFYGAQTLVSLCFNNDRLSSLLIKDKPRLPFRGLMMDVSRNFHSKETIIQLLDAMAMYKLNKFHFHLTDDDGWRLEIPALPELTQYGSQRCQGFQSNHCLLPSLGSGPRNDTSGSGFYTMQDYRDILQAANANHIQVIPEIDMPGHAMAVLSSMSRRAEESIQKGSDPIFGSFKFFDGSNNEETPNGWKGNVLNPCLESTYVLISAILDGLIKLHSGVQDLKIVHLGGDEVQSAVWSASPACATLLNKSKMAYNQTYLKSIFLKKISEIANRKNLDIMFWNDGLYESQQKPWNRKFFNNSKVFVNAWYDRRGGNINRLTTDFADAGYKTVVSMATLLYFDHHYENDPEEPGMAWAINSISTSDVFNSIHYFFNMACQGDTCLKPLNPQNIYGVQAQLWSELVRDKSLLHHMLFPRMLAVAERAWHRAPWEIFMDKSKLQFARMKDWESFANCLGHKELMRLEQKGIHYRVPPPGAILNDVNKNTLSVNTMYPMHDVFVNLDSNTGWQKVQNGKVYVGDSRTVLLKSVSPILRRSSKIIRMRLT